MEQDPERIENRIMVDIVVSIINQTNFRFQNIFARSTTSTQAITTNSSTVVDLTDNVAPVTFGGASPRPVGSSSSITTDNVAQNTPKPSLSARGTSPRATTNTLHRSDPQTTVFFSFPFVKLCNYTLSSQNDLLLGAIQQGLMHTQPVNFHPHASHSAYQNPLQQQPTLDAAHPQSLPSSVNNTLSTAGATQSALLTPAAQLLMTQQQEAQVALQRSHHAQHKLLLQQQRRQLEQLSAQMGCQQPIVQQQFAQPVIQQYQQQFMQQSASQQFQSVHPPSYLTIPSVQSSHQMPTLPNNPATMPQQTPQSSAQFIPAAVSPTIVEHPSVLPGGTSSYSLSTSDSRRWLPVEVLHIMSHLMRSTKHDDLFSPSVSL
jgi:hypothetical protein